jgi:hypothetical protein
MHLAKRQERNFFSGLSGTGGMPQGVRRRKPHTIPVQCIGPQTGLPDYELRYFAKTDAPENYADRTHRGDKREFTLFFSLDNIGSNIQRLILWTRNKS